MAATSINAGLDILCMVLCCLIALLTFGYIGILSVRSYAASVSDADFWGSPPFGVEWVAGSCKVHDTGISNRGGCWEKSPGSGQLSWSDAVTGGFSECPGWQWCADEGGSCDDCDGGDVMYSGALFANTLPLNLLSSNLNVALFDDMTLADAAVNHVPSDSSTFQILKNVDGPVECTHGAGKPFQTDPWPGQTKACFCLPRRLKDVVTITGPIDPNPKDGLKDGCMGKANSAYVSEASLTAHRRLFESKAAPENVTANGLWALTSGHCRRGVLADTYMYDYNYHVYLNWALVEVQEDSPGQNSLASKLRCAYTYGAPMASYEDKFYRYSGIYHDWKSKIGQVVPCHVRKGGIIGESQCAVALKDPAKMQEDAGTSGPWYPTWWGFLVYGSIFLCPICVCFCFCCLMIAGGFGASEESDNSEGSFSSEESDGEDTP